MEILLDTANLDSIRYYQQRLPLAGVTTNPSILKKEGTKEFFQQLTAIKQLIGQGSLHVQVVGQTTAEMIADAETILERLGSDIWIKIPVSAAGLATIQHLKKYQVNITATAIYSEFQGYLAIAAGADYLAPYYNRMENLNSDAAQMIQALAAEITRTQASSKILAASFQNIQQVNQAIRHGAHAFTAAPEIFEKALGMAAITQAVTDFQTDWRTTFATNTVAELGK